MAFLLVAAPDVHEAAALHQAFVAKGVALQEVQVGTMRCTSLPDLDVLVATGGNGKAEFGVRAQHLIDHSPGLKLLACVGAAGSLASTLQIGDVVVGTATVEHDYKARFTPRPLPRHDGDANLLRQFSQVADTTEFRFRVHFGPIASGDEDIVDSVRAAEVRRATDARCVAWEGSGGARAARISGIGFLEIRGITDAADSQAAAGFHNNVNSIMANIVDLLLAWHTIFRAAA